MTKVHDKKFDKHMEEMREINKHIDEHVRAIQKSCKSINRYLDMMNFTFIAAIVILLVVDFVAVAVLLK